MGANTLTTTNTTVVANLNADLLDGQSGAYYQNASNQNAGTLASNYGGTGLDGSAATNGQLLIGNGTGYALATLTPGSGITVTNGAGSVTIASTLGTAIDNTEITDDTIKEADLNVTNAPTGLNGYLLSYVESTGNFQWVSPGAVGAGDITDVNTSALTGLTGGTSAGAATLAFDYSATLAGSPALAANATLFGSTGLFFEGTTADAFEGLLTLADPTADNTWTLPNLSGTLATLNGGQTFTSAVWQGTAIGNAYLDTAVILSSEIDTSAKIAGIVTDETGSGALVFATSPTLVTPVLGIASATSVNKIALTTPATGATLTIADGKTLTASNTLTFTGTDASSVAFGTGGTVAYTADNLSAFAATTSAQLAGVVSDETGTGALVFSTSPTFGGTPTFASLSSNGGPLYTNASGVLAQATAGTSAQVLHGGATPSFSAVSLTADVSGILPVANGGTGASSLTDLIALGSQTTGNYVTSVTNGSGISGGNGGSEGAALTLALGALTGDWNQTGAFNISLNNVNAGFKMLENGATPTLFGIFDVADLSTADKTYTFPDQSGTVTVLGNTTTGSGSTLVLATSPTLVTPTIGAATATSVNGLSLTSNADGFAVAGGTASRTLTITGSNITLTGGGNTLTMTGSASLNQNLLTTSAPTFAGLTNTGGETVSGGTINLNASSNFAVNIATGTSTGAVSIGSNLNTFALNSTALDISTAGVISGATGITSSGTITFSNFSSNGGPLYTNASGVVAQATAGTATQVLHGGTTPSFSAVSLTTDVSGILPVLNGGTNASTIGSAGTLAYSTGTAYAFSAVGTTGQALISGGTGAPTWFAPTLGSILFATTSGALSQDNANFFWDNTNKRLGLGDTTPDSALDILSSTASNNGIVISNTNAGNYNPQIQFELAEGTPLFTFGIDDANGDTFKIASGSDITGTSQFTIDSSGVTSIANLSLGAQSFEADAGAISWIDMPVTSSATAGTVESYSAQLDGNVLLTLYGTSDGLGGVSNLGVGIGTATPSARLEVADTNAIVKSTGTAGYGSFYAAGSGTNPSYLFLGNAGGEKGRITSLNDGTLTFSNGTGATERMQIDSVGNVGIGGAASSGIALQVSKSLTGSTSAYNIYSAPTNAADVTANIAAYASVPATANAVTNVSGFWASQGTFSGAATNQYGFRAGSNLTGATNNYGFYGDIASGTNRYNLYMNGTAQNYLAGNTGIGNTPYTDTALRLSGTIGTATTLYSVFSDPTVPATTTGAFVGITSNPNTAASAFTLPSLIHFRSYQGTIGAGSSITTQEGFRVDSTLTGATNNYGFRGMIASGTNRYNLYMDGTADNYLAGNVGIGTGTTTNNVFDQVGAARPLVVQKSDTSTTLGGSTAALAIVNGSATTNNTAQLNFAAITGASTNQYSSAIISAIFGARTNAQYPTGQLAFLTSTSLNSAPTEKMRIDNIGNVGIGTATPLSKISLYGGAGQLTAALTDAGVRDGNLALDVNNSNAGSGGSITFGNNQSLTASSVGWASIKGLLTNGTANTIGDLAFSTRNATGDTALTERMRILANGSVGIGVSAPSAKVEIKSLSAGSVTDALVLSNPDASTVGTGVALHFQPNGQSSLARTASIKSRQTTTGNYADLGFFVAAANTPTEALTIAAAGNVGIGDTTPDHLLDIAGNLGLNASSYLNFGDTDGTGGYGLRDNAGTVEYKNSAGAWSVVGSGMAIGGSVTSGTAGSIYFGGASGVLAQDNAGLYYDDATNQLKVRSASGAQFRLEYDATNYSTMTVDASGYLAVASYGKKIQMLDENLWVCGGGTCPAVTPAAGQGNIIVENGVYFGNGFKAQQVSASELGVYNSTGSLVITFDEAP